MRALFLPLLIGISGFVPLARGASIDKLNVVHLQPGNSTYSAAWAINDTGQIVGDADNAGFLYQNGTYTYLNIPGAYKTGVNLINQSGEVVGSFSLPDGDSGSFTYVNGKYTILPQPAGLSNVVYRAINNAGQIVGTGEDAQFHDRWFLYSKEQYTILNVPGFSESIALGINNKGEILGVAWPSGQTPPAYAFVYTNGKFTSFRPSPDFDGFDEVVGSLINDSGQVVTNYADLSGHTHNFIWDDGVLTSLPNYNDEYTLAEGINNRGDVAGEILTAGTGSLYLYRDEQFFTTSAISGLLPAGMNDRGQIVGSDSNGAFLASPTPEPTTIALFLIAFVFFVFGPTNPHDPQKRRRHEQN